MFLSPLSAPTWAVTALLRVPELGERPFSGVQALGHLAS